MIPLAPDSRQVTLANQVSRSSYKRYVGYEYLWSGHHVTAHAAIGVKALSALNREHRQTHDRIFIKHMTHFSLDFSLNIYRLGYQSKVIYEDNMCNTEERWGNAQYKIIFVQSCKRNIPHSCWISGYLTFLADAWLLWDIFMSRQCCIATLTSWHIFT